MIDHAPDERMSVRRPGTGRHAVTVAAVSALLALCSSLLWGTSDFVAGLKAKTMPAAAVVGWSQRLQIGRRPAGGDGWRVVIPVRLHPTRGRR